MNNYQLNDEIGKGSFSTVYKGRRRRTIEYYAIASIDKSRRQRVLNRVQILRSLRHLNIIHFHNWYETNNHLWVITEYCTGGDMRSILALDKKLSETSVHVFGRDIAAGLLYIHSRGVVYNDLQPCKLLMDSTATLRYFDFSLSCYFANADTRKPIGTPLYMAPELFLLGRSLSSVASDLWSFGCVLYEMATGEPPFTGGDLEDLLTNIFTKEPAPIPQVSDALQRLIRGLLVKDPLKRMGWAEVVSSDFWAEEEPLLLPVDGIPHQPAFEAYASANRGRRTPWTEEEVHEAVVARVTAARNNWAHQVNATDDAGPGDLVIAAENDFSVWEADAALASPLKPGDRRTASSADSPNAKTGSVQNSRQSSRPVTSGHLTGGGRTSDADTKGPSRRSARASRASEASGAAADGNRRRGSRRSSYVAEERVTRAELLRFDSDSAVAKMGVEDLLWHSTDAHIRPLCMNNRIERYTEPTYDASKLVFTPHTVRELKSLTSDQLTRYITTIYRPLSSSSVSEDVKLHVMHYLETICSNAPTANVLVNSSVMTLCVRLSGQLSASVAFRTAAASIMGLLVRHTTFILDDLAKSGIVPNIIALFEAEPSNLVQRKLLGCIGEFLFYVAVQPARDRPAWAIAPEDVRRVYMTCLHSSDDVLQHYAVKAIENLASVQDRQMVQALFCTPPVVERLLEIYVQPNAITRNEHLRSSAICAAMKLAIASEELIPVVLKSTTVSPLQYGPIIETAPIVRTSQLILTFLNFALVRAMASTGSPYTAMWCPRPRADSVHYPSLDASVADAVLAQVSDLGEEIVAHLNATSENDSVALRGKVMLFVALIGCQGGTSLARICSPGNVSYLDRLVRDGDAYLTKCAAAMTCICSVFIAEKLSSVSRRVSSSTTPVYLAAVQQLHGAPTIRRQLSLPLEVFESVAECIGKAMSSSLYGVYEDDLNKVVERIVQSPEAVLQYHKEICRALVPVYADMVGRKEGQRRFCSIRILLSIVVPLSADRTIMRRSTAAAEAVTLIVSAVAPALGDLLQEASPIPAHTLRLLHTCAEWMPRCMTACVNEGFVRHLCAFMTANTESDLRFPAVLLLLALETAREHPTLADELLAAAVRQRLPQVLVANLQWAITQSPDHAVEASCGLCALVLKSVSADPTNRTALQCLAAFEQAMLDVFLPLCASVDGAAAEHAASVIAELTRLSATAQTDVLAAAGVEATAAALTRCLTTQTLTVGEERVAESLVRAMRQAGENNRPREVQKVRANDAFLAVLRRASRLKSRAVSSECNKLLALLGE